MYNVHVLCTCTLCIIHEPLQCKYSLHHGCPWLHHIFCIFVEVVEHSCSITSLQLGETLSSVTKDMDTYTIREPLGVCAGVTPFNFPAMIPLWVSN